MSLTTLAAIVLAPPFPYAVQQRDIIDILMGYNGPAIENVLPRVAREHVLGSFRCPATPLPTTLPAEVARVKRRSAIFLIG